jgi:hypothetical protein
MQRKKTTLQTSYRLQIDGCHSINSDGLTPTNSLSRGESLSTIDPLFSLQLSFKGLILSAKKQNRNLGLSSAYQIWGPLGSKEWKEKLVIGKLVRNNGIYSGNLTDYCQESLVASCPSQYLSYVPGNKRGISVKVLSGGLDKLLHVVAALQVDPTTTPTPPPTDPTSPSSSRTTSTVSILTSSSPPPPPPPLPSLPINELESSHDLVENNDSELLLQSIVDTICSSKSSSSQLPFPLSSHILLLQSRRPKKLKLTEQQLLSSSSSSSYYTIHYGDKGRVRNPSRKNIVMERMKSTQSLSGDSHGDSHGDGDSDKTIIYNNIFLLNEDPHGGTHLLEPEWMSNESNSMSSHSNGNVFSPSVDLPVLQVPSLPPLVLSCVDLMMFLSY